MVVVATFLNLPFSEMSRWKFILQFHLTFFNCLCVFCKVLYNKITEIIALSPIQKKEAIVKQVLFDNLKICSL